MNTGTSLKVQYVYTELAGGANHSRLKSMTYPNGRILRHEYTTGLDDSISRLSFLADDSSGSVGTHLEEYSYLGLGTVVTRAHPQPSVDLTYVKQLLELNGDAGDQYTGLDRFGRIADQRWRKTSDGSHTDRFSYGYDRNSNRLWRDNLVNTDFGEIYYDGSYDPLDRMYVFKRGLLAYGGGVAQDVDNASATRDWELDALGNWSSVSTNGTPQSRTHNKQNQLTQAGTSNLTYDGNGSLTASFDGASGTFDAWNRLKSGFGPGGESEFLYRYDVLGRRVYETDGVVDETFYYSANWQVVEEWHDAAINAQYVWSPVYVDAIVLRDRDTITGGGLEERLYAQHDANFNVTALVNTSGAVVERYVYDPYGAGTVLDANWAADADGASDVGWQYLHQGGRYDPAAGLYHFRNRDYSPTLGRWVQQDPAGCVDGMNLYVYVGSNPQGRLDPLGLKWVWIPNANNLGQVSCLGRGPTGYWKWEDEGESLTCTCACDIPIVNPDGSITLITRVSPSARSVCLSIPGCWCMD